MPAARVRWGILGVAGIAVRRVIPAMRLTTLCEVVAIASRDRHKAEDAARSFGIPRAYGSYDQLLEDRQIDVVYTRCLLLLKELFQFCDRHPQGRTAWRHKGHAGAEEQNQKEDLSSHALLPDRANRVR